MVGMKLPRERKNKPESTGYLILYSQQERGREGSQDGSNTCCDVRLGDGDTDKKRHEVKQEVGELEMLRRRWTRAHLMDSSC